MCSESHNDAVSMAGSSALRFSSRRVRLVAGASLGGSTNENHNDAVPLGGGVVMGLGWLAR
jgi:hypothetical protein